MQQTQSLRWASQVNNDRITLQLSGELSRNTLLPLWQQRASFLLGKASAEQNRKTRFDYLAKAEQLLLDSSVLIPLSHVPAINVIDLSDIKGWYVNAVNIHPFKFIRFAQPDPLPGVALHTK